MGGIGGSADSQIVYNSPTGTTNAYVGDVVYKGANQSGLTSGYIYAWTGTAWAAAIANSASKNVDGAMLAIATSANSSTGMLIRGLWRDDNWDHDTAGNPWYVSDSNAGQPDATAPASSGEIVRIVGYQYGSDNTDVYFAPDNTWIEI